MSNTLTFKDSITRIGHTEIGGVRIAQYTCTIDAEEPENMVIGGIVKLRPDLYKENRHIVHADYAEFEDKAYELQDKYIAQKTREVTA